MHHSCPHCHHPTTHYHGKYSRKSDSKTILRYRCPRCLRSFSQALFSQNYRQNKRRLNPLVLKFLCSGVSQRRLAMVLQTTQKTIARKMIFLAKLCKDQHQQLLKTLTQDDLRHLQFDDLITSHHTKLKPLSVSVLVTRHKRKILACAVAPIPAFGHIARPSVKKYGPRKTGLPQALDQLFSQVATFAPDQGRIDSDEHKLYGTAIKKHLRQWQHQQFQSIKAAVAGQGELKKKARDPLFAINHTLAMMRANLNRLFRRTWCTTKSLERLEHHLWLYIGFHNRYLTN